MAKFFNSLDEKTSKFINEQKVFFVATAAEDSLINISPKGLDTLVCLDDNTIMYLDLHGSGNETATHLNLDGRLTMMFCSFGKKALILRLYGHGQVINPSDKEWPHLYSYFKPLPNSRQIIVLNIESVQKSCGLGVPMYKFIRSRDNLLYKDKKKTAKRSGKFKHVKNKLERFKAEALLAFRSVSKMTQKL